MQRVSWYKIDKTVSSPYDGEFTKGVQEIVKMEVFFGQDESLKGRDEQHSAQLSPGLNSLLARENKMDGIKCPNQRLLCVWNCNTEFRTGLKLILEKPCTVCACHSANSQKITEIPYGQVVQNEWELQECLRQFPCVFGNIVELDFLADIVEVIL